MTEYEIADMLATQTSLLMQGQSVFITVFSAYMVVAYLVGAKMTRFQVVFISVAFVLVASLGVQGAWTTMNEIFWYSEKLSQIREHRDSQGALDAIYALFIFCGLRIALVLGALTFLWRVRNPGVGSSSEWGK